MLGNRRYLPIGDRFPAMVWTQQLLWQPINTADMLPESAAFRHIYLHFMPLHTQHQIIN